MKALRERACALGFDTLHIAPARVPATRQAALRQALAQGHHGTMAWLETTVERRRSPEALWPQARSALVLAMNYGPAHDPLALLEAVDRGVVAAYAQGDDYHDVLKGKLKHVAQWLTAQTGAAVKVFVDTAPLMEKPLAQAAGLGWQGKHTNLVSRKHGSWLLLGVILTDLALPTDPPATDHCGGCRRCLDVCPTDAFPAPYRLDARRCLSYLTIEHAGPIPHTLRTAMGNRIFGCDDCLAVCPWNKFAERTADMRLQARTELTTPSLVELADLDEQAFRARFRKSPIKRTGRARFVRNVLIAIGNSGDPALAPVARRRLGDRHALVRGAAVWALGRLMRPADLSALRRRRLHRERDHQVRVEWQLAASAPWEDPLP